MNLQRVWVALLPSAALTWFALSLCVWVYVWTAHTYFIISFCAENNKLPMTKALRAMTQPAPLNWNAHSTHIVGEAYKTQNK